MVVSRQYSVSCTMTSLVTSHDAVCWALKSKLLTDGGLQRGKRRTVSVMVVVYNDHARNTVRKQPAGFFSIKWLVWGGLQRLINPELQFG